MFGTCKKSTAALAVALLFSGCASYHRPVVNPDIDGKTAAPFQMVIDDAALPEMDIDTEFDPAQVFLLKPVLTGNKLPSILIQTASLSESGVFDALAVLAQKAGLTLVVEGGSGGSEKFGKVTSFNVKGGFDEVLEDLSENMGFFYQLKRKTLHVQQEEQFVISLPPALTDDTAAGLTNTLQFLGAKEPFLDRMNRTLVFKTNRKSLDKIENYLNKMREQRALLIYDVSIFQVDLKDGSNKGIQWNSLGWANSAAGAATSVGRAITATNAALGMGVVLSTSKFTIDSLIQFLETQGSVKTISRPRISVLSGSKGSLRVGQTTTVVSKIGSTTSNTTNQITTETKDIKTGLELNLHGDLKDNTVYTRINMSISELVRLNKFVALGTDLTLPEIADRELDTVTRARSGDMILLGGIKVDRHTADTTRGLTNNVLSHDVQQSELVLALRAKVVHFKDRAVTMPKSN